VTLDDTVFVLDAAAEALIESGYEVERVDEAVGAVVAKPMKTTGAYGGLTRERRLSTPAQLRRMARIRIVPEAAGGTGVYCQVAIQQQTTEAYRMFQQDRQLSDAPGQTAIERDAATTTDQNTVWKTVRRDKAAERRILEAIVRRTEQPVP
jgi:hypothetical protein